MDRELKQQLELTNYSIELNFQYFSKLIGKPTKHIGDIEQLRRFIQNIPYLQQVTHQMVNRQIDKLILELSISKYKASQLIDQPMFHIILSGEVLCEHRCLVKSDTFNSCSTAVRDCILLSLRISGSINCIYPQLMTNNKLKYIQSISVFGSISNNRLRNVLNEFKESESIVNTVLYKDGHPSDYVYLIISGEVLLTKQVQLQLASTKSLFGEMELVEQQTIRMHKATVTQHLKYYKISMTLLKQILLSSHVYDLFTKQYNSKKYFWDQRIKSKKEQPIKIDYSEFTHVIPKTYHNYISVTKLRGRKISVNLNSDLKQARQEKFDQLKQLFHKQIKLNFKSNYNLRKVCLEYASRDISIIKELKQVKTPQRQLQINVEPDKPISRTISTATGVRTRISSPHFSSRPQTGKRMLRVKSQFL